MKTTKILAMLLACVVMLGGLGVTSFAATDWSAPAITISTADELKAFADQVNAGEDFAGQTITLGAEITLSGEWAPIGGATRSSKTVGSGYAFKGTFNGNNKKITGLTITGGSYTTDICVGLFGALDGATVKNLTLENININVPANDCAGGVAGLVIGNTTIDSVTVSGSLTAAESSGGIAGRMISEGHITNCVNNATISGGGKIGGIVGGAYYQKANTGLSITGCTNNGPVTSTAGYVGGITGLSAAEITNCVNTAAITGSATGIGGIVGDATGNGFVTGCTNSGNIKNNASAYGTGGIVGWVRYNDSTNYTHEVISVTNNKNTGTISGGNDGGGIVGTVFNAVTLSGNENSAASISGTTFAAGVVANIQQDDENGFYTNPAITIANNVSTTAIENITGSCKNLYAYDNMQSNDLTENSQAWVASIGDTKYATLQTAINAAKAGDTIQLLAGTITAGTIKFPSVLKNVTIKGADNKGTTLKDSSLLSADGSTMTYEGITIDGIVFDNSYILFTGWRSGAVVFKDWAIKNCEFNNVKENHAVGFNLDASSIMENITFTNNKIDTTTKYVDANGKEQGKSGFYVNCVTGNVTITGNTFENIDFNAIQAFESGTTTMVIKENYINGTGDRAIRLGEISSESTVYINNNVIISDGDSASELIKATSVAEDATISLENNYWSGKNTEINLSTAIVNLSAPTATGITGGTFTVDVSAYVAEGCEMKVNSDGTYTVTEDTIWTTATDAGYYLVEGTPNGVMRFLFYADIATADVTESGIKYVKAANITENITTSESATGTTVAGSVPSNAFYGDVIGVPAEAVGNTYYAVAYVTTADKTYWSNFVECTPNFSKLFTNYTPEV